MLLCYACYVYCHHCYCRVTVIILLCCCTHAQCLCDTRVTMCVDNNLFSESVLVIVFCSRQLLQIGVKSGMAQQLDIPLQEITVEVVEDFECSWTCFYLVAAAKKWDTAKQLTIILTMLRGKLVDYYVELSERDHTNIKLLKKNLSARAGLTTDPLSSTRSFSERKRPVTSPAASRSCLTKPILVKCMSPLICCKGVWQACSCC